MRQTFLAVLLLVTASSQARADCSSSPSYEIGSDVSAPWTRDVSIDGGEPDEACGGSVPMLRQNIDTGDVVQLAAFCDNGAYVDECIAPGRYRYGLATPLPCAGCGGSPFFGVAEVPEGSSSCARSTGDAGTTPYTGTVPWPSPTGSNATDAIDYVCTGASGCNTGGKLRVHIIDLLALCGAIAWSVRRRRSR